MSTEGLSSICTGLGCIDEDDSGKRIGYTKGEYCLDNLKDLVRFLRRDDPNTREVFKQVCKWNIVLNDLIPIVEYYNDDRNLVLNAVKVLVFLTMPVEVSSVDANEQLEYLWGLKSAIIYSDVIAVVVSLLEKPLENLEHASLTEDDRKLVQLVLTLFRNILAVQEISIHQKKAEGSANHLLSLRDSFVELLFRESVTDLLIVLTQHVGGYHSNLRQDNLLLLEIFHYIFKGHEPELVAKTCSRGTKENTDAKASAERLRAIMEEEERKKKMTRLQSLGRHSQFSGTFMRFSLNGSKALFKGNPAPASCDVLLKPKVHLGASKRVVGDHKRPPTVKNDTLFLLHDFLDQFLSGGYNVLMQSILEDIEKDHHSIQNNDVGVFFQLAQFATNYQYYRTIKNEPHSEADFIQAPSTHGDGALFNICGPIAETMNEMMFALVTSKWRDAIEFLKETNDYKFPVIATSLFKSMICMLDLVLKQVSKDSKETQAASALLYKLFYDQTDQGLTHFILNLMKSFDNHKQPKSYLADLVEIIYLVLQLMETLQANGTLRVSKKSRKCRKSTVKSMADTESKVDTCAVNGEVHTSGAAEHTTGSHVENTDTVNSECDRKHSILVDGGPSHGFELSDVEGQNMESNSAKIKSETELIGECVEDKGDSSGDEIAMTSEVDFKITSLLTSLASGSTIKNICWLLRSYKSNPVTTNNHIICMLQRICDDLNLSPMLYQLSYLCTFYDILDEQKSRPCKDYESLVTFLTTFIRRLLRKMKSQPLLFVEVLFSKTRGDCHFINTESIKHELSDMGREVRNWELNTNNGEASSRQAMKSGSRSMSDALGDDEYDVLVSNEQDVEDQPSPKQSGERKRKDCFDQEEEENMKGLHEKPEPSKKRGKRKFCSDSKEEGHVKGLHENHTRRASVLEENLEKIRSLFEEFKDHKRCSYMIANALDPNGTIKAAQVSCKLRQLGLWSQPRRKRKNLPDVDEATHDALTEEDSDNMTLSTLKNRKSKTISMGKEKVRASTLDQLPLERKDPESGSVQSSMKRHVRSEPAIDDSLVGSESIIPQGKSESEGHGVNSELEGNTPFQKGESQLHQQSYSELEDSDDDMGMTAPLQSLESRRKLRMVIDLEEDE